MVVSQKRNQKFAVKSQEFYKHTGKSLNKSQATLVILLLR